MVVVVTAVVVVVVVAAVISRSCNLCNTDNLCHDRGVYFH